MANADNYRYENTYHNLVICVDRLDEPIADETEIHYKKLLINLCREMIDCIDDNDD